VDIAKRKSPALAELKLQKLTNMAMSEKVGVFASGSARNPTSLAFVFCFDSIWAFPLSLSFIFHSVFSVQFC